ncbi:MAG: hypothetical protein K2R98_29855 [Gemmataceae bacterium]|nr:hypothetical protein [Gemmataceae bacterium]
MELSSLTALGGSITTCFLAYLYYRYESRQRELQHTERMRALESGHPVPDGEIAQASADTNRAWAIGLVALLVPAIMAGAALWGTAMVFNHGENPSIHLPLTCVIWGVSGLVSLVTVATGLGVLACRRKPKRGAEENKSPIVRQSAFEDAPIGR